MPRYSTVIQQVFRDHYSTAKPKAFRALLAAAGGGDMGERSIHRLAKRLKVKKRRDLVVEALDPDETDDDVAEGGGRVGNWEDQVRDASMQFAGLPRPNHTQGGRHG